MSKRLQVVVSGAEYDEIRDAAGRNRETVSAWVRRELRQARASELQGRATIVGESRPMYREAEPSLSGRERVELTVTARLLDTIRERYGFADRSAAAEFALRRIAVVPMTREEALAMQGTGWGGDLDELRAGDPGDRW